MPKPKYSHGTLQQSRGPSSNWLSPLSQYFRYSIYLRKPFVCLPVDPRQSTGQVSSFDSRRFSDKCETLAWRHQQHDDRVGVKRPRKRSTVLSRFVDSSFWQQLDTTGFPQQLRALVLSIGLATTVLVQYEENTAGQRATAARGAVQSTISNWDYSQATQPDK